MLAGALAVIAGDGEKAGSSVLAGREAALCVVSSYSPGLFSLWWRVEQSNRLADPALEHFTSMMMRGGKGCLRGWLEKGGEQLARQIFQL